MEHYLASLGSPGGGLLAVAGFWGLGWLLGSLLLRYVFRIGPSDFVASILGIDLLVLSTLALGSVGLLRTVVPGMLYAGAAAFVVLAATRWRAVRLPLAPLLVMAALLAMSFPYSWDDLTYQVAVPWRWYQEGSTAVYLDLPYSAFPGANLLADLFLIATGGLQAPALFNASLWLALCWQTHNLLREHLGPWSATSVALAFGCSLPMLMTATAAYAELLLLAQVVALVTLVRPSRSFTSAELGLCGILSGFAAAVKLTGLIVPVIVVVAAAMSLRERRWRLSWVIVSLLLVLAVFYARPTLATGNPCYPYFAGLFTANEATLAMSRFHHDAGKEKFGLHGKWEQAGGFIVAPVLLSLGPLAEETTFDGVFGLQFLVFLALAAFGVGKARQNDGRALLWLGCAVLAYVFWYWTSPQARFLLPAAFLLTLAAGAALAHLSHRLQVAIAIVLPLLTAASVPWRLVQHVAAGWSLFTGAVSPADYVVSATDSGYLQACSATLQTASGSRILLLFEKRGLYLPRPHAIGTPFFQERFFTPPEQYLSEEKVLETLRREKFGHVLVSFVNKDPDHMASYDERMRPFQEMIATLIRRGRLEGVWQGEGYGLYRVGD